MLERYRPVQLEFQVRLCELLEPMKIHKVRYVKHLYTDMLERSVPKPAEHILKGNSQRSLRIQLICVAQPRCSPLQQLKIKLAI